MKHLSLVLVAVLVVASAFMAGSFSQLGRVSAESIAPTAMPPAPQNRVVVEGQATVMVQPDIAKIDLNVQTRDVDSKVAQAENKKIMNNVIAALNKAGVANKDITTSHYNIYHTYDDYDYPMPMDEKPVRKRSYQVTNGIVVKTTNIDEVGKLIDVATAAGANDINGIRFESSKADLHYQEALQKAMANAKSKATAITATFGKTVDVPLSVSEVQYRSDYNR
ncbi:MAG: hypothetical protein CSB19_01030, partial [Clostridiales bacterium]